MHKLQRKPVTSKESICSPSQQHNDSFKVEIFSTNYYSFELIIFLDVQATISR